MGISGSIAAYKAGELLRLYQKNGAQTRVIMTKQATEFITPLTIQGLSGNQIHSDLVDYKEEKGMGHIQLARWADALIIAPASASTIARMAKGEASDLLSAVFLATTAPRFIAPAMNKEMWAKSITQQNIKNLGKFKDTYIVQPGDGWQACGEIGAGRMAEPQQIARDSAQIFATNQLANIRVLVTAGPTREPIDTARYISNYSSGKMGYAIARAAVELGAKVTLISGPTALESPSHCHTINIETAQQMISKANKLAAHTDIFIATAAVADFRPAKQTKYKIAKEKFSTRLELAANPDILKNMGELMPHRSLKIGFAAESEASKKELIKKAKEKIKKKRADMICINILEKTLAADDNKVLLLFANGKTKDLPQVAKSAAARLIMKEIVKLRNKNA